MHLLGGNSHLAAKAEFSSVGESCGSVNVYGGAVHSCSKAVDGRGIPCYDSLAVVGGVLSDMGHGFLYAVHHADSQDLVQKFRIKILLAGRSAVDHGGGAGIPRRPRKG